MGNGGRPNGYKAQDFIVNIPGSAGVYSTIAKRVGCDWRTVKKYVETMPTVEAVYNDECETNIDVAESVVLNNIKAALARQQKAAQDGRPEIVDSADAKWYLTRKGKSRGYVERSEITGADGNKIILGWGDDANA